MLSIIVVIDDGMESRLAVFRADLKEQKSQNTVW